MSGIFISYRRDDTGPVASTLHEGLRARFGPAAVFMDVAGIEPGEDFGAVIDEKVGFCDALIAVIGTGWLASADAAGRRRLDDPSDWVRLEIAAALDRGIKVIPLLVDGATLPPARALPGPLARLPQHQALELRAERFDADVRRLGDTLERLGAGRNAVSWFSLLARRHRALDPLDLQRPEVLRRSLRFLLYMVLAGGIIRLPAAMGQGQEFWLAGYVLSYAASNWIEWVAAAVLLHLAMRLAGGTAPIQKSVAAVCFLSAYLPVIGLAQIPVWGLHISVVQEVADLRWAPDQALAHLQRFTEQLGAFATVRVVAAFAAATALWAILLGAVFASLRTLHRLSRPRALVAFAGGLLTYAAFLALVYAPLIAGVYRAFGMRAGG
jgi:hypothetical protein